MPSRPRVKGGPFLVRPFDQMHAGVGRWGTAFWQSEKLSKFLLAGGGRYKKIDRVPGLKTMLAARDVGRAQAVAEMGVFNQQSFVILMSCHKERRTPSQVPSIKAEQIRIVQYPVPV
jgi:hypothetical protein